MSRKIIAVDVTRCMACHSCEIACAVAHSASKTLAGALAESPRQRPRVHVEHVAGRPVPIQCQHCDDAPCVAACPSGAVSRAGPEEPVLFDSARCIGCRMCVQACPFGAITIGPDGKGVLKCDLCIERLSRGVEPACVSACPTRALRFEDVDQATRRKRRTASANLLSGETK